MNTRKTRQGWMIAAAIAGGLMLVPTAARAEHEDRSGRGGFDRGGFDGDRPHPAARDRGPDRDRSGFHIDVSIGGRHGHHSHHSHHGHHGHHDYHRPAPGPASYRHWVPGHYVTSTERVLVQPGHYDKVWHEPVYETRYDRYGCAYRVLVQPGHYDKVWHEAEYETRTVRKWVPGRWEVVHSGHHYPQHGGSGVVIHGRVDF